MNSNYEGFIKLLDLEDKDKSVNYALELLKSKKVTLEELYLDFLAPALTTFVCQEKEKEICIWKEHTRTSIIRTILECTYPFVIERRNEIKKLHKKVVILTPSEEYHEIGAIIVNHFFMLAGFDSQYIGANTPKNDILMAVKAYQPDFVAISVTNYYNIVITKQITDGIKKNYPNVKIIVGGQAFLQHGAIDQISHDYYMQKASDVFMIAKEVK
jgi:methanogenic corrinoid protein MtbC1